MGICCRRNRCFDKPVIFVDCSHYVCNECNELQILLWSLTWCKQQYASIGAQAPVVVLTRAVDAGKWLLVKQCAEVVAAGNVVDERHQQQVMVVSQIGFLKDRSKLKLIWSNLVVASLGRNTKLVAFGF